MTLSVLVFREPRKKWGKLFEWKHALLFLIGRKNVNSVNELSVDRSIRAFRDPTTLLGFTAERRELSKLEAQSEHSEI